jgi:hypothetical protein
LAKYLLLLLLVPVFALADSYNRRVVVINNTSYVMYAFHASNVSRDSWEEDILGDESIMPGERAGITIDDGSGYCLYDLRATFFTGDDFVPVYRYDANVCEINSWTINE